MGCVAARDLDLNLVAATCCSVAWGSWSENPSLCITSVMLLSSVMLAVTQVAPGPQWLDSSLQCCSSLGSGHTDSG